MFDAIFGPHDTHPQLRAKDPGYLTVEYPDGSGAAIYCGGYKDGKDATGMMFNHGGGPSFWADLYELADRSKSIIFWPSEKSIYVYTDESVPKDVPEGAFDTSRFVRSGIDIVTAIEAS